MLRSSIIIWTEVWRNEMNTSFSCTKGYLGPSGHILKTLVVILPSSL